MAINSVPVYAEWPRAVEWGQCLVLIERVSGQLQRATKPSRKDLYQHRLDALQAKLLALKLSEL